MHSHYVLALFVAMTSAVPLNINLGAYSPALVVGDGEISVGSAERASELIETLATGAAAAGGNGNAGEQQQEAEAAQAPPAAEQQTANERRDASAPANRVRSIDHLVVKRSPAPAPQPDPLSEDRLAAAQEAIAWIKRDLAGFQEALGFAREAMKDQPQVELGTGEEGSGVGVIVHGGLNVPVESAANGAKPAGEEHRRVRRSDVVEEEAESPKMTLVAITEV